MFTLAIFPTREPFANGTRRVARVHTASTASGSSGTRRPASGGVRSGRERFAAGWLCSVNARVDASGRERRTVCACLQTDLFIS